MKLCDRKLLWLPDVPDARDLTFFPLRRVKALPDRFSLRPKIGWRYDQLDRGSCTGQATASAHRLVQIIMGKKVMRPSRLFIYYNARVRIGTQDYDSGAQIRDCIKSLAAEGVCSESRWKHDVNRFAEKPPPSCYQQALDHQAIQYRRVPQTNAYLKEALFEGVPVVLGFSVYESFMTEEVARTGTGVMPKGKKDRLLRGHAVILIGWNDAKKRWELFNSWGRGWGDDGFFTLPYGYLEDGDLAADFWQVKLVEA